ncbi:MAG: 2-methylaconitate cis-trans isomerase PrpF [Sphingomonas sp.]|jgi:probable AcnD-accessory protein PrpF|nr:MAG: 2-methylaconitate cis-trans isomerase PrpF [Sphingomonas sp.]
MRMEVRATFMRGGTSKGLFFDPADLPADPLARDRLLLRAIGSPDPYGQQIDGMGGGSSSTSKAALVSRSARPGYDLDYYSAALPIDAAFVDWSGNCGNLAAAVAPFAFHRGMLEVPRDGIAPIRIWQVNTARLIVAHVPFRGGLVKEHGDFILDGVAFPAAEIRLDFESGPDGPDLFPTGSPTSVIEWSGGVPFEATLIDAGSPTILVHADALWLTGMETAAEVNANPELLAKAERMRAHAAVRLGFAATPEEVTARYRQSPKLAYVNRARNYVTASGTHVDEASIDLVARTFSMGKLHHAMTGTGTVAIAAAAAVPNTIVSRVTGVRSMVRIGHASGSVPVGAESENEGGWRIRRTSFSRSARILMDGTVFIPV